MSGIHSCSYFCTRPACVAVQRDTLRDKSVVDDGVRRAALTVIAAWDKHGTAISLRGWIDILRERLAEPVAIPGAIPMAEVAARSRAMPERAAALGAARERLKQAEPVADDGVRRAAANVVLTWSARYKGLRDFDPADRELIGTAVDALSAALQQMAEPHKPATEPADGQFMSQADGNASY